MASALVVMLGVLSACGESVTQIGPDNVAEVLLSPDSIGIPVGRLRQLRAAALDSTGALLVGQEPGWLSRAPLVATVDETGLVTGVAVGSTYVIASLGGHQDSASVTVSDPPVLSLSEDSLEVDASAGAPSPAPDSLDVTNGGVFPLVGLSVDSVVYSGATVGWLSAQLDASAAPAKLVVQTATSGITTAGTYRGRVWVSGLEAGNSPASVVVTLRMSAGAAASVTASAGEGQTGSVGTAVATAPSVRVVDAFGNSVTNVGVTFLVTAGGGTVTGGTASTDTAGVARVGSWTLGTVVGIDNNSLSASAAGSGISGNPVTFTASAVAGAAASITISDGNSQSDTVGAAVPIAPRVLVRDQYGNPVASHSVTFAVTAGGGSVSPTTPVLTQADGTAQVTSWTLGTVAGTSNNTLIATAAGTGVSGNPVTFTASAVAGPAQGIVIVTGDAQSDTVGTAVSIAPQVRVRDQYDNAVANHPVTFAVTGGGGSVSPTTAILTQSDGTAQVTSWTLGTVAGTNNNTLSATAAGTGISSNPLAFTASAVAGPAASITISAGNTQTDTVGTAVPIAPRVLVRDQYDNAVAGHSVTFAVTGGGGSVSPTTALSTLADGTAQVTSWTLGTVAGTSNNTLSATAAGSGIGGSPVTFTASAVAGPPTQIAVAGGNNQSALAGSPVTTPPSVVVGDQFANPVQGVSVTFAVATGGGSVTGANQSTDSDGLATVGSWTLGTSAGPNSLDVVATGVVGSATVTATGISGQAAALQVVAGDAQVDTVAATLPVAYAVRVVDSNSNPVEGVPVTWTVTGGGGSIASPTNTDPQGLATSVRVLGTAAGAQSATATVGGLNVITFTATATVGAPAVILVAAGGTQSDTVNTVVAVAPQAKVTDQFGNPIANHAVTFAVTAGGGSVDPTTAIPTLADGTATVTSWTLGTVAGTSNNTLSATAAGTNIGGNPVTFTASAVAGPAQNIVMVTGDAQTDTVGTAVPIAPQVRVRDQFDNPVASHSVTFAVTAGGGAVDPTTAISTLADGTAAVGSWTLGTTAGASRDTLTATAAGSGISGNPVRFVASSVAGPAQNIVVVTGDAQSDTVATSVPIAPQVRVRDQYDNPIANHSVTFAVTSGGGTVDPTSALFTLADGTAQPTSWTLGTVAGTNNNTLSATAAGPGINGNPVAFTASGLAGPAQNIVIVTGNAQVDTVGTAVPIDPQVRIRDQYNNDVANHSVTFAVTAGGGSVDPTTAISTLADGTATVTSWTLGTTAGTNGDTLTATAAGSGISGNPVRFVASSVAGPPTSVAIVQGDGQTAVTGTNVTLTPTVVVRDVYSNPVPGRIVSFTTTGGSVGSPSPSTGSTGQAQSTWAPNVSGGAMQTDGTFPDTLFASVQGTALAASFNGSAIYSYLTHIDPIWSNCTGCHGGTSGLTFDASGTAQAAAANHAAVYNVSPVCDGSLAASGYRRVTSVGGNNSTTFSILLRFLDPSLTDVIGLCGPHADMGAFPTELARLRAWIRNGAPNN